MRKREGEKMRSGRECAHEGETEAQRACLVREISERARMRGKDRAYSVRVRENVQAWPSWNCSVPISTWELLP